MATFQDIQTNVLALVIDAPAAVQAAVPRLITRAQRRAEDRYNFEIMKKTQLANTVALTTQLLLQPADFKEWRGKPYYKSQLGQKRWMRVAVSEGDVYQAVSTTALGAPRWLVLGDPTNDLGARPVNVYPLPDSLSDYVDGQYRITIPYWRHLPVLSGGADQNWFTNNGEEYLEQQALADAFRMDHDEERADYWQDRAMDKWTDLVTVDKKLKFAGWDTLVPHMDANEPMLDD